jgi:arylformamidase
MALTHLPPQPPMSQEAERYAAWCVTHTAQAQASTRHVLDIPYGSDYWHKLDVYQPETVPLEGAPVLLFMHGGYWSHGYKDWLGFMAPAFVSLPALFISVDYRLAPAAPYPAALDDCLDALAWVFNHASAYGGDPQQLFVGGHSAGGHLAALMALQPARLVAHGLPADVIKACFPVSGVYDINHALPQDRLQAFLPDLKKWAEASPIRHISGNQVPFLLAIGERDFPVLYQQAYAMEAALSRESAAAELLEIADADHFQINQQSCDSSDIWVQRVRAWMQYIRQGVKPDA